MPKKHDLGVFKHHMDVVEFPDKTTLSKKEVTIRRGSRLVEANNKEMVEQPNLTIEVSRAGIENYRGCFTMTLIQAKKFRKVISKHIKEMELELDPLQGFKMFHVNDADYIIAKDVQGLADYYSDCCPEEAERLLQEESDLKANGSIEPMMYPEGVEEMDLDKKLKICKGDSSADGYDEKTVREWIIEFVQSRNTEEIQGDVYQFVGSAEY